MTDPYHWAGVGHQQEPQGDLVSIWQRIAREPNALTGIAIALYGVLVAFGVLDLTPEQTGALAALGGAVVFALRWLTTPASEVVAQRTPSQVVPVAGPALESVPNGEAVHITRILGKA